MFNICWDPLVYIIFTVLSGMAVFVGYFCEQFERHPKWDYHECYITGFCCFLGFPCHCFPSKIANRFNFIGCSLGGIVFVCTLSSILIELVMTPILSPQVQSVQEIIEGNFRLVGDRFAFQKLSQQTEVNVALCF